MPSTTNMNIPLPTVTTTLGPAWATLLNEESFVAIDLHDHSSGKGVAIPSSGLLLDADLPFNNNNATALRSARLANQGSALALATDRGCIYRAGAELYFNDGDGNQVQITSGGSVNAGAGSIGGLPSGTATVAYASGPGSYVFQQATGRAATMDGGPVIIRDTTASALGITVASPSGLAGAYTLTLPGALAAGIVSTDGAGQFAFNAAGVVATDNIAALAVTRPKMVAVGQQVSAATGVVTITGAGWSNITNAVVTITTTGRPVIVMVQGDTVVSGGWFNVETDGYFRFLVTGSASTVFGYSRFSGANALIPASLVAMYIPAAGTYTIQFQASAGGATDVTVADVRLIAYEL